MTDASAGEATVEVAYVMSRYPSVSHTFIWQEVLALRARGTGIATFSVRPADSSEVISEVQRSERRGTTYLLPVSWARLLRSHLAALRSSPAGYARTLRSAMRSGPEGARPTLWRLFYFAEAIMLWHDCRRRGLRHIHAHFAHVTADVSMLAARFGRAADPDAGWTWSLTVHGPSEFSDVRFYRLPEKIRDAAGVVCISDYTRSQLMRLVTEDYWPKLRVIRCGVDTEAFRPERDPGPAGTSLRVLCVGRLVPDKGQRLLLRAVADLVRDGLDIRVSLVGDGPDASVLRMLVIRLRLTARVEFHGAVPPGATRPYYAAADAFVLPSLAEGLPIALMEAMAMRLPVVSTRIMGVPELVSEDCGLLVSPGRVDELTGALARLVRDPDARIAMGAAGRHRILADYTLDRSAEDLRSWFTEITASG